MFGKPKIGNHGLWGSGNTNRGLGLASAGSGAEPQRGAGQRPAITRLQVLVTDDPPKARGFGSGRKTDVPPRRKYKSFVLALKDYKSLGLASGHCESQGPPDSEGRASGPRGMAAQSECRNAAIAVIGGGAHSYSI